MTQHWQVASTLESIAEVLRRVDRDALEVNFDNNAIEYFYEPFLAAYDPELRDRLGVWYTPKQIASYQVARCDHHLKAHLGVTTQPRLGEALKEMAVKVTLLEGKERWG